MAVIGCGLYSGFLNPKMRYAGILKLAKLALWKLPHYMANTQFTFGLLFSYLLKNFQDLPKHSQERVPYGTKLSHYVFKGGIKSSALFFFCYKMNGKKICTLQNIYIAQYNGASARICTRQNLICRIHTAQYALHIPYTLALVI